jgi:hypothetical protein
MHSASASSAFQGLERRYAALIVGRQIGEYSNAEKGKSRTLLNSGALGYT